MLFVLPLVTIFAMITAMPYRVPLQGIPGGKRTLVLLDDMVRLFLFTDFVLLCFRRNFPILNCARPILLSFRALLNTNE
jgi:Oligosaccharyltransferase 48 kDa subunit beta